MKNNSYIFQLLIVIAFVLFFSSSSISKDFQYSEYIEDIENNERYIVHTFYAKSDNNSIYVDKVLGQFNDDNAAELIWQKICVGDKRLIEYRSRGVQAFDFNIGKSRIDGCTCYEPVYDNGTTYYFNDWPDKSVFLSNTPNYNGLYDRTIFVLYKFKMFPDTDKARQNSEVKSETTWFYEHTKKMQSKTVVNFEFCGDGKTQIDKGEECDDGVNNGKPENCDCNCKEKKSKKSKIEKCK